MDKSRRFTVIDEEFFCTVCGAKIPRLNYTARDHCRECLCSLHLDINPGDRMSECKGVLRPIGIEMNKKGYQIIYSCEKCKIRKKNITAEDDNMELIIKLSSEPVSN